MHGATLINEVFTDLDFTDDVAVIVETVEALLLALEVMQQEALLLSLEINWPKTKNRETENEPNNNSILSIVGQKVEIVDLFVYLGCTIHKADSSIPEITRKIALAQNCMKTQDKST